MKMMLSYRATVVASVLLLCVVVWSGCKKVEGCTDPNSTNYNVEAEVDDGTCAYLPSTLSLQLTHKVGNLPFALNTEYQDSSGRRYKFTTARFHFSSPFLSSASGQIPLHTYLHVEAGAPTYTIAPVEPGDYQGLSFDVGVDSVANHGDPSLYPAEHPLSILNPIQDHWAWNVGYVFLKIEGMVDSTSAMNGSLDKFFFFHIATDPMLTTVSLSKNFTMEKGKNYAFPITMDWGRVVWGVNMQRQTTQTSDNFPLAQQILHNFISGITAN